MRIHAENSAEIFSSRMDLWCNRHFKLKIANFDILFRHEYIPAQENTLKILIKRPFLSAEVTSLI